MTVWMNECMTVWMHACMQELLIYLMIIQPCNHTTMQLNLRNR